MYIVLFYFTKYHSSSPGGPHYSPLKFSSFYLSRILHLSFRVWVNKVCLTSYRVREWVVFIAPPSLIRYGAAEGTDLCFVCFVVINPRLLSATELILGFFFHKFSNFTPTDSSKAGSGFFLFLCFCHLSLSSFSVGFVCYCLVLFFVCLEFQIIRFVICTFSPNILHRNFLRFTLQPIN